MTFSVCALCCDTCTDVGPFRLWLFGIIMMMTTSGKLCPALSIYYLSLSCCYCCCCRSDSSHRKYASGRKPECGAHADMHAKRSNTQPYNTPTDTLAQQYTLTLRCGVVSRIRTCSCFAGGRCGVVGGNDTHRIIRDRQSARKQQQQQHDVHMTHTTTINNERITPTGHQHHHHHHNHCHPAGSNSTSIIINIMLLQTHSHTHKHTFHTHIGIRDMRWWRRRTTTDDDDDENDGVETMSKHCDRLYYLWCCDGVWRYEPMRSDDGNEMIGEQGNYVVCRIRFMAWDVYMCEKIDSAIMFEEFRLGEQRARTALTKRGVLQ